MCYKGEPIQNITGLEHLEGENITILADGCVVENKTVQNGKIQLDYPASTIVAGLPYEFELETLNLEGENTHGLLKIVNEINICIDKSREDFFVVGQNGVSVQNIRSMNSINNHNYLYSGNVNVFSFSDYSENATVHIKQIYPLPLTINSISLDVTVANSND